MLHNINSSGLSTLLAIYKRIKITDKADDDRITLNRINKSYKEPWPLNEKQNNSTLKNIRPRTEIKYDTNEGGVGVGAQLKWYQSCKTTGKNNRWNMKTSSRKRQKLFHYMLRLYLENVYGDPVIPRHKRQVHDTCPEEWRRCYWSWGRGIWSVEKRVCLQNYWKWWRMHHISMTSQR